MMNENLLAPPKIKPRTFAWIYGGMAVVAVLILIGMCVAEVRTVGETVRGAVVIVFLHAVAILAYARFLRLSSTIRSERMPLVHLGIFVFSISASVGTIGVLFWGSVLAGFRETGGMFAMMAGFFIAQCGWNRRVGETKHCPQCEYEFGPADEAVAPTRCPECGTNWLGKLKKGRRVRSRKLMAFGVVFGLSTLILLNPIFYLARLAPHMPTPALFASLYASPNSGFSAWDELANRPLDQDWAAVMARKVLSVRQRRTYWMPGAGKWFEAMIAGNQLPPELVDRYYRESFVAEINAPSRVKAGDSFAVTLRVKHAAINGGNQMGIMFAGYAINDAEPQAAHGNQTIWILGLKKDVRPSSLVAPDAPEFQLRAVFWLVHQPSFIDDPKWQDDGTPTRPTAAVWFERHELVKTIKVVR